MKLQRLLGALCAGLILISLPSRAAEQSSYVTPVAGPMNMATFAGTHLNPALRAIASCHNGSSAPANGPSGAPIAYQCWVDTTANPSLYKIYDGTSWITLGSINTSTHVWLPYLTGGTSGGVPYFSATNIMGTSAALAQYGFVVGAGAGAPPATIAACTNDQIPFGVTSSNPLCRTVTGDVTFATGVSAIGTAKVTSAMMRNSAALSVIGRSANSTGVPADITTTLSSDGVLRESGGVVGFGPISANAISSASLAYAKIQNLGALSLMGRSANSSGVGADISASATSDCVFRESSSTVGCGTVATAGIANNAVTNAKQAMMAAYTLKGNATGSSAAPTDISIPALTQKVSPVAGDYVMIADSAASNAIKYVLVSSLASAGSVSSIAGNTGAFTLGTGLGNSGNTINNTGAVSVACGTGLSGGTITSGGSGTCAVSLSVLTNSLGANVTLNNTSNYFDGPTVAQGTSGTWMASGTVTLIDTGSSASFYCKLWDGTTVIASGAVTTGGANYWGSISLHGYLASPAANIRISCRDASTTAGFISYNGTSLAKDSTISVYRIQ